MNAVKKKSKTKLIRVGDYFQTDFFDILFEGRNSVILSDSFSTDFALTLALKRVPVDGYIEATDKEDKYRVGDSMDSILESGAIYLGNIFDAN